MPSYIMYIKVERKNDGNTIEHKPIIAENKRNAIKSAKEIAEKHDYDSYVLMNSRADMIYAIENSVEIPII